MTTHTDGSLTVLVGNVKRGDKGVYIGRQMSGRKGSPLGNPFRLSRNESTGATLERYRAWLRVEYAKRGEVHEELHRLRDILRDTETVTLICWCSPDPCHGDVIADALLKLAAAA